VELPFSCTDVEDFTCHTFYVTGTNGLTQVNLQDRVIIYTPPLNFYGSDSIVVQAIDSEGAETILSTTIQVTPVNDPPAINCSNYNSSIFQTELTSISITPTDPETTGLTITWNYDPSSETTDLTLPDENQTNWQFIPDTIGSYNIVVNVSDGENTSTQHIEFSVIEKPTLWFENLYHKEDSETAALTARLQNAIDYPISFVLSNLESQSDFVLQTNTYTIPANSTSISIPLSISSDSLLEETESFEAVVLTTRDINILNPIFDISIDDSHLATWEPMGNFLQLSLSDFQLEPMISANKKITLISSINKNFYHTGYWRSSYSTEMKAVFSGYDSEIYGISKLNFSYCNLFKFVQGAGWMEQNCPVTSTQPSPIETHPPYKIESNVWAIKDNGQSIKAITIATSSELTLYEMAENGWKQQSSFQTIYSTDDFYSLVETKFFMVNDSSLALYAFVDKGYGTYFFEKSVSSSNFTTLSFTTSIANSLIKRIYPINENSALLKYQDYDELKARYKIFDNDRIVSLESFVQTTQPILSAATLNNKLYILTSPYDDGFVYISVYTNNELSLKYKLPDSYGTSLYNDLNALYISDINKAIIHKLSSATESDYLIASANNEQPIENDSIMQIKFNKPVKEIPGLYCFDSKGASLQGTTSFDVTSTTISFLPDSPLKPSEVYSLQFVTAVTSTENHNLSGWSEFLFSTKVFEWESATSIPLTLSGTDYRFSSELGNFYIAEQVNSEVYISHSTGGNWSVPWTLPLTSGQLFLDFTVIGSIPWALTLSGAEGQPQTLEFHSFESGQWFPQYVHTIFNGLNKFKIAIVNSHPAVVFLDGTEAFAYYSRAGDTFPTNKHLDSGIVDFKLLDAPSNQFTVLGIDTINSVKTFNVDGSMYYEISNLELYDSNLHHTNSLVFFQNQSGEQIVQTVGYYGPPNLFDPLECESILELQPNKFDCVNQNSIKTYLLHQSGLSLKNLGEYELFTQSLKTNQTYESHWGEQYIHNVNSNNEVLIGKRVNNELSVVGTNLSSGLTALATQPICFTLNQAVTNSNVYGELLDYTGMWQTTVTTVMDNGYSVCIEPVYSLIEDVQYRVELTITNHNSEPFRITKLFKVLLGSNTPQVGDFISLQLSGEFYSLKSSSDGNSIILWNNETTSMWSHFIENEFSQPNFMPSGMHYPESISYHNGLYYAVLNDGQNNTIDLWMSDNYNNPLTLVHPGFETSCFIRNEMSFYGLTGFFVCDGYTGLNFYKFDTMSVQVLPLNYDTNQGMLTKILGTEFFNGSPLALADRNFDTVLLGENTGQMEDTNLSLAGMYVSTNFPVFLQIESKDGKLTALVKSSSNALRILEFDDYSGWFPISDEFQHTNDSYAFNATDFEMKRYKDEHYIAATVSQYPSISTTVYKQTGATVSKLNEHSFKPDEMFAGFHLLQDTPTLVAHRPTEVSLYMDYSRLSLTSLSVSQDGSIESTGFPPLRAAFNSPVATATVTTTSVVLLDSSNNAVSGNVYYNDFSMVASFVPDAPLTSQSYTFIVSDNLINIDSLSTDRKYITTFTHTLAP
jgi:hypothetical protein